MTVAELMKIIGFSTIDVLMVTPAGRMERHFDIDHVSENNDIFYMEDPDGYSFELSKDSEVRTDEDGIYSINKDNCLICIKLNV